MPAILAGIVLNSMATYTLLIKSPPYSQQSSLTAYQFAKAAIAAKHDIKLVFFYQDAVYHGNQYNAPPRDEPNLTTAWQQLAQQHNIALHLCSASAVRRGIPKELLAPPFMLSGLGQFVLSCLETDKVMEFGG